MKNIIVSIFTFLFIHFNINGQNQADSDFYKTKQSKWLSKKIGAWNVIMTLRPVANKDPLVVEGLVAERSMVGAFCLHEIMHPATDASMSLFERLSDLDYNLNDDRWDYISIDSRITGGIMYFTSYESSNDSIVSYILNFPHPGFGPEQKDRGKNVRVKNVIISLTADHEVIKQYWKFTDGAEWLAVKYEYLRKK
jgi:hypothetical protein